MSAPAENPFFKPGTRRSACRLSTASGRSISRRPSIGRWRSTRPRSPRSPARADRPISPTRSRRWSAAAGCSTGSAGCSTTSTSAPPMTRSTRSPATTRRISRAHHTADCRSTPTCSPAIAALYRERDTLGLAPDQLRLLERYHLRFVRSGALLGPGAEGAHGGDLRAAGDAAHPVRPERAARRGRLAAGARRGRSRRAAGFRPRRGGRRRRASAASTASMPITLARASVEPFLTFSARRDLRRTPYEAWTARGAHAGRPRQRAADPRNHGIARRAGPAPRLCELCRLPARRHDGQDPAAASGLLREVWEPARRKAAEERAALRGGARTEGLNEPIAAWDWRYYAEKVRQGGIRRSTRPR